MEHHATVDKGLKMKIKKKKSDSKGDTRQGNSLGHTSTFIKDAPKGYPQSPLIKPATLEMSACDKSMPLDRQQTKKEKHKHDKHTNKVSSNNQMVQKFDASNVKQSSSKSDKSSKNEAMRVDTNPGQFSHNKSDNKLSTVKKSKDGHGDHHPQFETGRDAQRGHGPQLHDPYEFNSKEEDRVNQASQGGLLLGLSAMKLKVEKGIEASPRQRLDDEQKAKASTNSVGVVTDPECLGPCEPGTSVVLEGIVWNETENGILVVNVTWRGKTYVGTLMDSTKHNWAPPRFSCDSPVSDLESKTPKGRGKRGRLATTPVSDPPDGGRRLRQCRRNTASTSSFNAPASPAKNSSSKRKNMATEDTAKQKAKKSKSHRKSPVMTGDFIVCPEPDCNKKYRHINGLRYHQSHAHQTDINSEEIEAAAKLQPEEFTSGEPMDTIPEDVKARLAGDNCEEDANTDDKMDKSCDHEVANLNGLGSSTMKPEPAKQQSHLKKSSSGASTGESVDTQSWGSSAELRNNEQPEKAAWTDSNLENKDANKKSASPPPLTSCPSEEKSADANTRKQDKVEEEALSPAYSDISDVDDRAPLLENQTESECSTTKIKGKFEESSSEQASDVPLGGYRMFGSYYGQPPYLTPAVPSDASKLDKPSNAKELPVDGEPVKQQGHMSDKQVPPSLPISHNSGKPFRYVGGYDRPLGQPLSAHSSPVGSVKSNEHLPKDLSSKEPKPLSTDRPSSSVYPKHNPDGNFQILKENMELKDQIRDRKEPSKDMNKTSHEKSYASVEGRYGFDKYGYYPPSSKPGEKVRDGQGSPHIKIKEERIEKEVGKEGRGKDKRSPYPDTPGSREENRDSKSGASEKPSLPPRSVQSPSMHPSNLPYYPGGYPSYAGPLPYDAQHPPMMMPGYPGVPGAPYLHPHQLRYHEGGSPAHSPSSSASESKGLPSHHPSFSDGKGLPSHHPSFSDGKGLPSHHPSFSDSKGLPSHHPSFSDSKGLPSHHPSFYSTARGGEPKTVRASDSKPGTPGTPEQGKPGEEGEPPVQRHLHSHHHTHVVGPPYSLFPPHGPHWNPML